MERGWYGQRGQINPLAGGKQRLHTWEGAYSKLGCDGCCARCIRLNNSDEFQAGLLAQFAVDAYMVAPEGACADDRYA
jgi:hypothetical protein